MEFGGPEVLQYGDVPDPVAAADEVIVDVHAATVNAADWKFRGGEYARHAQVKFPQIPGRDFSGTLCAKPGGDLKVGDAVFGVLEPGREGTYCEKIAIRAAVIGKKPEQLSHVDAAALALTGLDRDRLPRRHAQAAARRNDPDPGRRRRRRRICHSVCQVSRRARHHHDERREHRLCARPRRRRGHRLQRAGLHQSREGLRRRV